MVLMWNMIEKNAKHCKLYGEQGVFKARTVGRCRRYITTEQVARFEAAVPGRPLM